VVDHCKGWQVPDALLRSGGRPDLNGLRCQHVPRTDRKISTTRQLPTSANAICSHAKEQPVCTEN
jgi:hypothetical protein